MSVFKLHSYFFISITPKPLNFPFYSSTHRTKWPHSLFQLTFHSVKFLATPSPCFFPYVQLAGQRPVEDGLVSTRNENLKELHIN